jgi:predicted phage terminase large subunit-like protein
VSVDPILIHQKLSDRERARKDKFFLATDVLGFDHFDAAVHQELLDQFIAYDPSKPWIQQSSQKDCLILWARGHLKTTAIQVAIIQAILNFPDIRILIMQGSVKVTKKLLAAIKSHFTGNAYNSRLRELFPEFCADKLGNSESFTVPCRVKKQLTQATLTVASPRSIKTGEHYDIGFFDDLVNDQNYKKTELLNKTIEDFNMCEPLLLASEGGFRVVTGTRYAFGDLYETIILKNAAGWKISVKTCWTDDGKGIRFPRRQTSSGNWCGFTREQLEAIRAADPGMFASQYENKPVSTAFHGFTDELLQSGLVDPHSVGALSQAVLFIDIASTTTDKSDDSVVLAAKVDGLGRMYVADARGGKWTHTQLALHVIEMAVEHRPLRIMLEKSAAGHGFVELLQLVSRDQGVQLPLEFMKMDVTDKAKQIRILPLADHIRTGRLKFFMGLSCWGKMVEQFCKYTGSRKAHDDYPDTVALMVQNLGAQVLGMTQPTIHTHPFIRAMEERYQEQQRLMRMLDQQREEGQDSCGDGFAC